MTLTARNNFLRGGIILAGFSLIFIGVSGYFIFTDFPAFSESAILRSNGFFQSIVYHFALPSAYVPFWTMVAAAAYSLISIAVIYYFFEKTQSPEVLFLSFFAISLSFEFARMMIPLTGTLSFPSMYSIAAFRSLLFGRYFGLFSLFAAGLFAAGYDFQKQQTVFSLMVLASMLIASYVPVDNLYWDSTFIYGKGYASMLSLAEMGIFSVTIISFFISAYLRDSRTYISIGIGVFLAFTGRNMLLLSDTWITPLPGFVLLCLGTWFACSKLHKIYLWL
ncbi:MAG: hypothetical protein FWG77_05305 [Treponema sp.]|nr:hypothetical protein [Treponema sp.]